MSKRTLLLIIFLVLITAGLLYIALKGPTIKPSGVTPEAVVTPISQTTPQSTLTFGALSTIPSSTSAKPVYSLPVILKTGSNKVASVQLEISFDPEVLTDVSIQPSTFFPNPVPLIALIDNKSGRVSYALGASPSIGGKVGQGEVVTLTFQLKKPAPQTTTLTFLPKSLVIAEGVAQSVLKATSSATITVGEPITAPSQP